MIKHINVMLGVMMLTACLCGVLCALPTYAASKTPNILLIYVDDLGYGDLGSFGHPVIQSPNIDSLGQEGMTLKNYYAPSALCSPSRAALLTGRYPYRTGIKSWIPEGTDIYLKENEITLAESLKAVGYQTALVGKWHLNSDLGSDKEPQPGDQGFDYFYGHNAFQIPTNKNPTNIYRNDQALPMQEGYTAQLYADEAIEWLNQREKDAPFFLFFSMAEPHTSIENPQAFNDIYKQYTDGEIVPIPSGEAEIPKDKLIPRGPGEYYANITYMDHQIGRVLDYLDEAGLKDDTLIVFTSDNGPVTAQWLAWYEVNAYGSTGGFKGRKHYLYEGGIKVPAFIVYPGVTKPGSVSDELIVGMDFFNTLARAGGGEIPADRAIDGMDITGALKGLTLSDRTLVWALPAASDLEFVVREDDWKLLLDRERTPRELYNLSDDPLELINLIKQRPKKAEALNQSFIATMKSIDSDPISR
jgi:arylsulfatase A-like enzyme